MTISLGLRESTTYTIVDHKREISFYVMDGRITFEMLIDKNDLISIADTLTEIADDFRRLGVEHVVEKKN